jgi:probable rRNA maturation factor
MNIIIEDKQNFLKLEEKFFYKIGLFILEEEKKGLDFEISLLLVDNREIKELNRTYRNIDEPTDVLAFPMWEERDIILPGIDNLLGDVVISVEKAIEQAKENGHTAEKEIAILLIHAILHLFHYDHIEDGDAEKMKRKEIFYLDKLSHIF